MDGAGAVTAIVMLEWTVGWVAASAWTQSWGVVSRGNFRINAWGALGSGVLAFLAFRAAVDGIDASVQETLMVALLVLLVLHLVVQWSRTDLPGTVVGALAGVVGIAALIGVGALIPGWGDALAGAELIGGAVLLGGVTVGMLLGHWYLNQPGLKTSALGKVTLLTFAGVVLTGGLGIAAAGKLGRATTAGALGLPGVGDSFGLAFFLIWVALVVFTGVIVWATKRCIDIRSIQSATGLYYVALLTAGVAEFLVRYLMLGAS